MVEPMVVAWSGIHRTSRQDRPLVFHWRALGIPRRQERRVASWCKDRGIALQIYDLTGIQLRSRVTNEHLTEATTLRLVPIQDLRDVNGRVLYLDSDTVVLAPLDRLFEMPLGDYPCAAMDDPSIGLLDRKLGLGLAPESVYFNAGVLMINTGEWIKQRIAERAQRFLYENPSVCPYEDQDALNATIAGNFVPFDEHFNRFSMLEKSTRGWGSGRWAVIHFAARPKPWHHDKQTMSQREHSAAYWHASLAGLRPVRSLWLFLWSAADVHVRRAHEQYSPQFVFSKLERVRFVASHGYVVMNSAVIVGLCLLGRRDSALKWRMAKSGYYEDRLRRLSRYPLGGFWLLMIRLLHKHRIFS